MKKIGFKVFVAIIIISIFFVLYHLHILAFTENKAYNLLTISKFITKMHMTDSTISDVVIVELDDQTLEKYNNWPLNRKYYADAVDILENEGVKAIGFDIMLSDRGTRENDTILAEHFAGYDNIVLPVRPELKMERSASQNFIQRVNKINKPLPEFAENVSLGHIAFIPDSEGIIRSLPLKFKHRGKVYKALSLVLAETAGYEVKTNNKKSILINFSAEQIIPRISFKNLLSGNYSDVNLKDKIILIGATSTSLNDYYMTSLSRFGPMAGVEIHGQAINNLIKGNYINRLPHFYKLILLMILTIIFAIIFRIVSPARSKYILINGLLGYLIVSFIAFYNFNFFIDFLTPAVIILLLYGMNLLYWYLFSEKERQKLVNIFDKYISKDVMQELLNNPGLVKLGGEQVKLTVLFADIRGYTAYSEGKSPELMVEELNEVFTQINKKIFKNKGTLDKYLGDGVMAFFGAPLPIEEHSVNAVKTALEIMNLNLSFKLGIGINTGQAVAGNIGSRERMEYTVIGDSVNKAARFVEIAGPGEVIIGKSTYKSLSIDYKNRDWIKEMRKVRNINHETILYRLRGEDKIK